MASTPLITFLKTLLMVFNFIFWVTGVAILALGVWMKVQLHVYMELTSVYYVEAPFVLIGIGCGIILIGFLACCCTTKGKPIFLYMFSVFLFAVFIAELAVGIAGFVYRGKLEEGFQTGLTDAIDQYATDANKREAIDGLQEALHCCGKDSYDDWFASQWDGPDTPSESVPPSCCRQVENCQNTQLTNATSQIYIEGCYNKVTSFMETNFSIIAGVAIGFAFLQLLGSLLACGLAKAINKNKYEQVA